MNRRTYPHVFKLSADRFSIIVLIFGSRVAFKDARAYGRTIARSMGSVGEMGQMMEACVCRRTVTRMVEPAPERRHNPESKAGKKENKSSGSSYNTNEADQ